MLTKDGLRGVPLSQVQRVKFSKAGLDDEFRKALEVIATGHDKGKKAVSLNFSGEGKLGEGRLRRREPDLEDQLSPGPHPQEGGQGRDQD